MTPKFILYVFLFLFTKTSSSETSFDEWVSWHARKHEMKPLSTSSNAVDRKLRAAEANRIDVSVRQDGSGDYKTINEAINSIPLHNTRRVLIRIHSGVYREKVNIPTSKSFITLIGNASDPPTITGNDTASRVKTTFQSATVAVDADYFTAINVKFENTVPHVAGSVGEQAVAVRVSGSKAAFYNCSFYGSQDTLYDHKGLHYFSNCFIQGSVDFIFGYGTSLYENCYLNSVAKKAASITAQKRTNSSFSSGFSFKNCTITGTGSVYLGRAWGDYSRVVFSYTFMDGNVVSQGWSDWGEKSRDGKVYYGEYRCRGAGANVTGRVPWARILTDEEALPFLGTYYVDGEDWLVYPSAYQI